MKNKKATVKSKFKFSKEGGMGGAIQIGDNAKKGELRSIVGWIVGMKTLSKDYGTKKKPDVKHSHIIKLALPDGGMQEIWGGGSINYVLLDNGGEKNAKLKKNFKNVLCEFTFKGMLKAKGGKAPGRDIEIGTDRSVKLPAGAGRIEF